METARYQILVVGGGTAGVAAALETARTGLRTALIEKTILFGGMATSGLVPVYEPLCDGCGRQVTFGIAEELLHASIKYGPGRVPAGWPQTYEASTRSGETSARPDSSSRYLTFFAPHAFALALDELLEAAGVDVWLDTLACAPLMQDHRLAGVEVENKSGRIAVEADCVIDATGDADIAFRSGAPCATRGSYPSMLYQYTSLERARNAVDQGSARKVATWKGGGSANEFDAGYGGSSPMRTGLHGRDLSDWVMESRRIARGKLGEEQSDAGRENLYPTALPTMHQIRMSRRIEGRGRILDEAMNQRCDDSVGVISDCRKPNAVWEVPYGSIVPSEVSSLLVVGRCADADTYAWQVSRLIPAAALTGQVAGVAAEMAVHGNTSPELLAVEDIQRVLETERGFLLHA